MWEGVWGNQSHNKNEEYSAIHFNTFDKKKINFIPYLEVKPHKCNKAENKLYLH